METNPIAYGDSVDQQQWLQGVDCHLGADLSYEKPKLLNRQRLPIQRQMRKALALVSVALLLFACEVNDLPRRDPTLLAGKLAIDGTWILHASNEVVGTVRISEGVIYFLHSTTFPTYGVLVKQLSQVDEIHYGGRRCVSATGELDTTLTVVSSTELRQNDSASAWNRPPVTEWLYKRAILDDESKFEQMHGRSVARAPATELDRLESSRYEYVVSGASLAPHWFKRQMLSSLDGYIPYETRKSSWAYSYYQCRPLGRMLALTALVSPLAFLMLFIRSRERGDNFGETFRAVAVRGACGSFAVLLALTLLAWVAVGVAKLGSYAFKGVEYYLPPECAYTFALILATGCILVAAAVPLMAVAKHSRNAMVKSLGIIVLVLDLVSACLTVRELHAFVVKM